jgi:hypothetical protein
VSRDGLQESPFSTRWFEYEVALEERSEKNCSTRASAAQAGVKNWFNSDLDGCVCRQAHRANRRGTAEEAQQLNLSLIQGRKPRGTFDCHAEGSHEWGKGNS